ncbi:MAG: hypothetical protein AAB395_03655 [Patescibacteria group bacterium]
MSKNQRGFHIIEILIAVVVIGLLGFVVWRFVLSSNKDSQNDNSASKASSVTWAWDGNSWQAQGGTAPTCDPKPEFKMPADTDKVTSVLYPGQQRSTGYKTHGGFLFANSKNEDIDVTIPIDSALIKASRYIEKGDVQYFMVFTLPCGYAYRFDHLRTLTPKFQAIMDKLPEPKVDDSRTTPIEPAIAVKAGEKVATGVGFKKELQNTSMDLGIYDLRQPNVASKNSAYASKHADEKEFAFYGVCFLDYFDSDTASKLNALPAADQAAGKTSDYCGWF